MFLYTALIFVVALLLIILSFFGQEKLQKSQPVVKESFNESSERISNSISKRAALLSEENLALMEENKALEEEIFELNKKIQDLENNVNYEKLITAANFMNEGNKESAKAHLDVINTEKLSKEEQKLYDKINEFINE